MDSFLIDKCKDNISIFEVENKSILEVGSYNINGSFRSILEPLKPKEYIGVDIIEGKGVDKICDINNIVNEFGKEKFDIVVCTEVIEHIKDWRKAIINLMEVLKIGGIILLTSRSKGFGIHNFPADYWRYEIEDIEFIFQEYKIQVLCKDEFNELHFGFFLKAEKINNNIPDLSEHCLYNINTDSRNGIINNNIKRTLEQ